MPRVKSHPQDLREKQINNAILAFRKGNYPSISATAVAFDLPKSTLAYRMSGQRVSRQKAHVDRQLLTEVEERALVRWIKRLDDWGFPPRLDMVKDMARIVRHMETSCIHHWNPAHGPPKRTDPCAQTSKIRDRIFQLIPLRPRR